MNYRPVSLTCILSKLAESFVKEYVYNYLETTNYLCEEQHGFRSHRSCTTQLLLVSEILSKRIEDGLDTDVINLDFQKAFDKVSHKRLLLKVEKAGIQGPIYDLIKYFLSNRKHRNNVNGLYSSKSSVKSGIPQGSILGPLLFIIFINDLPDSIKNHCMMFADDTNIFGNPGSSLQLDIKRAGEWAQKWKMKCNVNKCKVLHFNKWRTIIMITIWQISTQCAKWHQHPRKRTSESYLIIICSSIFTSQLQWTHVNKY